MKKFVLLICLIILSTIEVNAEVHRCKYQIQNTTINILYEIVNGQRVVTDAPYSHHSQPLLTEKWYINIKSDSLNGITLDDIGDGLYCPRLKIIKKTEGTTTSDTVVTYNVNVTNDELKDYDFVPNFEAVIEHNDYAGEVTSSKQNVGSGDVQFGTENAPTGNNFNSITSPTIKPPGIGSLNSCKSILGDPSTEKTPAWYMSLVFSVMRYATIILLLVLSTMDFIGAVSSQDADSMKKAVNKLMARAIICVILFLLPTILDFGLQFLHKSQIQECININS